MADDAEIAIEITGDASGVSAAARQADRAIEGIGDRAGVVSKRLDAAGKKMASTLGGVEAGAARVSASFTAVASRVAVVAGAIAALAAPFAVAAQKIDEVEASARKLDAIIRATGGTAGLTTQRIQEFAAGLAANTLASTRGVETAAAQLLTFRNVSGEVFTRTLELAQDLAATGFGSLESSAVILGKALEDPIAGIGALGEIGVSFSATQKDMIRNFIETNQLARAQGIILETLTTQVGGAGAAGGNAGLAAAMDTLGQRTDEFFEALGRTSGAADIAAQAVNTLAAAVQRLQYWLDPESEPLDQRLAKNLGDIEAIQARIQELEAKAAGQTAARARGRIESATEAARRELEIARATQAELTALAAKRSFDDAAAARKGNEVQVQLAAERAAAMEALRATEAGKAAEAEAAKVAAEQERAAAELERLREHSLAKLAIFDEETATQAERILLRYEEQKAMLDQALQAQAQTREEHDARQVENEERKNAALEDLDHQRQINSAKGILSAGRVALGAIAQNNKKMFAAMQVLAAAEGILNAYVAFTQALADKTVPSTLAKIGLAASVFAVAMGAVASIRGASMNSSGGAAPAGGAAGGAPAQAQTIVTNQIDLSITGENFSRRQVVDLIEQINDATRNGARLAIGVA